MMKMILEVVLFGIIYMAVKEYFASDSEKPKQEIPRERQEKPGKEELVEDPSCGVYLPKSQALEGPGGRWFCSRECLDNFKARGR